MARKKKEKELFKTVDNKVIMEEKDITNLSDFDREKIAFFVRTLGYEMVFIEPEVKKNNYFTVEKAEKYLKENKGDLNTFRAFRVDADKVSAKYKELKKAQKEGGKNKPSDEEVRQARNAMVIAQREAFNEQKQWFKDTYGVEEYDKARKEY